MFGWRLKEADDVMQKRFAAGAIVVRTYLIVSHYGRLWVPDQGTAGFSKSRSSFW